MLPGMNLQLPIDLGRAVAVQAAVTEMATLASEDDRGAVFTQRVVVDAILDLVDYTPARQLAQACLLEPSFGHGDFLVPAVERLLASFFANDGEVKDAQQILASSIRGVELHQESFEIGATRVR